MQIGKSKSWQEALLLTTKNEILTTDALMEYLEPVKRHIFRELISDDDDEEHHLNWTVKGIESMINIK